MWRVRRSLCHESETDGTNPNRDDGRMLGEAGCRKRNPYPVLFRSGTSLREGEEMIMLDRKSIIQKSLLVVMILSFFLITDVNAGSRTGLSTGATVYVSIYSNVYSGPKSRSVNLDAMLSVRNTDPKFPITILAADYYDSAGKLMRRHIKEPTELKPLESMYTHIKEYDTSGGSGANFLVKWRSKNRVNKPIIEGIMTNTRSGLSFRCPGREIVEHPD